MKFVGPQNPSRGGQPCATASSVVGNLAGQFPTMSVTCRSRLSLWTQPVRARKTPCLCAC